MNPALKPGDLVRAVTRRGEVIVGTFITMAPFGMFKLRLANGAVQHLRPAELESIERVSRPEA